MLDTFDAGLRALRNITHATLINIPSLTKLVLRVAFHVVQTVDMRNASLLEEYDELARVQEQTIVKDLVIRDKQGLEALTYYVEKVTVVDECCNESGITVIDFTPCERVEAGWTERVGECGDWREQLLETGLLCERGPKSSILFEELSRAERVEDGLRFLL